MIFRSCIVGDKGYSVPKGDGKPSGTVPEATTGVPGTPSFRDPALDFDATDLLQDLHTPGSPQAALLEEFLVNLAVCHSIIPAH